MSASPIAENQYVLLAKERFDAALVRARALPVFYWQYALIGLAILWVCHSFASLVWIVIGEPELEQPAKIAVPVTSRTGSPSASSINLASLQELKLFGDGVAAPVEIVEEVVEPPSNNLEDNAETTRLNLKLQGVIASSDPDKAGAIIEEAADQVFYRVGDELKKNRGVKLAKVMEQRVILDNRGKYESLWLYSEEDFKKSSSSNKRRKSVPLNRGRSRGDEEDNERVIHSKARVDQLPKSVGDVVRFSVHREGGKMVGYRIRPGKDKALFEQLGLKTNDIVISVNGIDVDDPKKIRSVYKEVKTAPEAQLTVVRDGETFSINISLDTGG